jgi:uncharacterized membrane protein YphA (DoxX/SURF4 family)
MSHLTIPLAVLYAGLGGTVLALFVATATNRWSARVFILLALRLAIGWHFLFEGLYKVQSYYTGPTETSKPFTSEPYFRVAPGPIGERMRKEFADPAAAIAAKVKASEGIPPAAFAKLPPAEQAAKCPEPVAQLLDAMDKDAQAEKAAYARWVYGVDARDCKLKGITGDVPLTGPQRLAYVEWARRQADEAASRATDGLGNGTGTDAKRVAEFRTNALAAETELARDADSFIAELRKTLNGGKAVEDQTAESRGQVLDRVTMWFLVGVGACLLAGLFTRAACVMATGFLAMTYLAHPPFPWYPLPPNTEGNPVFVNKNAIEALALLALACYPTGRWLGLDALVLRPFLTHEPERPA